MPVTASSMQTAVRLNGMVACTVHSILSSWTLCAVPSPSQVVLLLLDTRVRHGTPTQQVCTQAAVLGFVGSPWTLATYLIEGGSTPLYKKIKTMTHAAPAVLQALLSYLATQIADYVCYQIESGAHCVQLFDSWGGQLPPGVRISAARPGGAAQHVQRLLSSATAPARTQPARSRPSLRSSLLIVTICKPSAPSIDGAIVIRNSPYGRISSSLPRACLNVRCGSCLLIILLSSPRLRLWR